MNGARGEDPSRLERVVRDYLLLGLRLGVLVDGFVDCWFGDGALARQVADEPTPVPAELVAAAVRLRRELAGSEIGEPRLAFLQAQVRALECSARRLNGEQRPFLAEVEEYFEAGIETQEPGWYVPIHAEIAALLPGSGDLGARLAAFHDRDRLPRGMLKAAAEAVSGELRAITGDQFTLPGTEAVRFEVVSDKPWNAFNRYHGGFRSTVSLNEDVDHGMSALAYLVTHEAYPGHHTEHCAKELGLVRERGWQEHAISLVNTPQCLLAEGSAELALAASAGEGWGPWLADVLARLGLHLDGERVERLRSLTMRLLAARQDAAIFLHDRGTGPDEVAGYLRRTMLVSEHRARHMVRFLTDPLWRAYTVTYIEGSRLVRAWLAARPPGEPLSARYSRLLTEPMLPSALRAEIAQTVR